MVLTLVLVFCLAIRRWDRYLTFLVSSSEGSYHGCYRPIFRLLGNSHEVKHMQGRVFRLLLRLWSASVVFFCRTLCNRQLSAPICLFVSHLPPSSNHLSCSPTLMSVIIFIILPPQSSPFLVQLRWLSHSTSFSSCRQIQRISVDWTKWQNHRGRLPLVWWEPAGESKLVLTSCVLIFWENQREHQWFDVNSINVFYPRHVLESFLCSKPILANLPSSPSAVWKLVQRPAWQLLPVWWGLCSDGVAWRWPLEWCAVQLPPVLHLQEGCLWVHVWNALWLTYS